MRLYSNSLSTIAMNCSINMAKKFPACFFCKNIFNLSQSSFGHSGKFIVEIREAIITADLSNLIKYLSLVIFTFHHKFFHQKTFVLQIQTLVFCTTS